MKTGAGKGKESRATHNPVAALDSLSGSNARRLRTMTGVPDPGTQLARPRRAPWVGTTAHPGLPTVESYPQFEFTPLELFIRSTNPERALEKCWIIIALGKCGLRCAAPQFGCCTSGMEFCGCRYHVGCSGGLNRPKPDRDPIAP